MGEKPKVKRWLLILAMIAASVYLIKRVDTLMPDEHTEVSRPSTNLTPNIGVSISNTYLRERSDNHVITFTF